MRAAVEAMRSSLLSIALSDKKAEKFVAMGEAAPQGSPGLGAFCFLMGRKALWPRMSVRPTDVPVRSAARSLSDSWPGHHCTAEQVKICGCHRQG